MPKASSDFLASKSRPGSSVGYGHKPSETWDSPHWRTKKWTRSLKLRERKAAEKGEGGACNSVLVWRKWLWTQPFFSKTSSSRRWEI